MEARKPPRQSFEPSTDVEREIARCAREGVPYKPPGEETPDVCAEFIRFLIRGGDDKYPVHDSGLMLERIRLASDLNLKGCMKLEIFSLRDCIVDGTINLDYAHTRSIFLDGTTIKRLTANRAQINGSLYLRRNRHHDDVAKQKPFVALQGVDLSGCVITGSLSVRGAEFYCKGGENDKDNLCFRIDDGAVKGNLLFGKDVEPLDMERVGFHGNVSLQNTHCSLFTDLEDSYREMFGQEHCLFLNAFSYDSLGNHAPWRADFRLRWLSLQPKEHLSTEFKPQPFEQIARTLRQMGYDLDARQILIAKAEHQQHAIAAQIRSEMTVWRRYFALVIHAIWHFLLRWFIAYGYKPIRAVIGGSAIILIGTFVFWQAYAAGDMIPTSNTFTVLPSWKTCRSRITHEADNPTTNVFSWLDAAYVRSDQLTQCLQEAARFKDAPAYPAFSAFWFSVDAFIPVLNLRQQDYWIPAGDTGGGEGFRFSLYIYTLLGWIVTSLGVAGLLGLVSNRGVA